MELVLIGESLGIGTPPACWMATNQLQWSTDGRLQQLWQSTRGEQEWQDVPTEGAK